MKKLISILTLIIQFTYTFAQVSINTTNSSPDASAMLDVSSTSKGVLVPRMTTQNRNTISNPATGLLVFDTDLGQFYYYSGSMWTAIPLSTNSVGASNGLISDNNIVKLGGSLSEQTILETSNNMFSLADKTTVKEILVSTAPGTLNFTNSKSVYQTFYTPSSVPYNAHFSALWFRYVSSNPLTYKGCTINIYKGGDTTSAILSSTHVNLEGSLSYTLNNPILLEKHTQYTFSLTLDSVPDKYWLGYHIDSPLSDGESSLGANTDLGFFVYYDVYYPLLHKNATSNALGIGKTDPSEALDIAGKTKTQQFQITNGAANGYILQSDASGNASWVNASSVETDPKIGALRSNYLPKWGSSALTNSTIYDNGNVGIGTTAPTSKLVVQNTNAVDMSVTSTNSSAAVNISAPNAIDANYFINTNAIKRWGIGKANNSEVGNNTGSYFVLNRYDDAGNYAGQPIMINRSNGTINLGNEGVNTTATTVDIKGSVGVKVKTVVSSNNNVLMDATDYMVIFGGAISNNKVSIPHPNTCAGRIYFIVNHSTSSILLDNAYGYITANNVYTTTIGVNESVQIVSDGTNWHKIN